MLFTSFTPILASGALRFAFEKATMEGKITIGALIIVSIFSWTVIITKSRQLIRAIRITKKFFQSYRATRDPLELARRGEEFDGAPAYEVYYTGAEETEYQLKNNPVDTSSRAKKARVDLPLATGAETDHIARRISTKMSMSSFESVKGSLERAASAQAMVLEKGMIVLSTAVAGGPFIGLLGTVWGVMETFSGIARANSASLTAMAPGVAGALIATVVGLFVAIPAMFAYNYMVTTIRHITQELDNFTAEYAIALEHKYVDNRSLVDELKEVFSQQSSGIPYEPELATELR
ncbi:MAG TPA: MotA/TolQ/ExbB proton channel family protein [Verrucomicrobiae bacterium]|nr:MotA/TolQ/ExbB proton channel family protein [Verrucomicrobiae bacterium]